MTKIFVPRKGMQYLMAAAVIASFSFVNVANAAPTIRAGQDARFWGEVGPQGQRAVCWRGFEANMVGDYGTKPMFHPLRPEVRSHEGGCVNLQGNGSFNLYWASDVNNADTRRALLVIANGGDGVNIKNLCREGNRHGAKFLVTADPARDPRCVR